MVGLDIVITVKFVNKRSGKFTGVTVSLGGRPRQDVWAADDVLLGVGGVGSQGGAGAEGWGQGGRGVEGVGTGGVEGVERCQGHVRLRLGVEKEWGGGLLGGRVGDRWGRGAWGEGWGQANMWAWGVGGRGVPWKGGGGSAGRRPGLSTFFL